MTDYPSGSRTVLTEILRFLTEAGAEFTEMEHPPTCTSEESARARGEELHAGAKALVMKVDDTFRLFVVPANRKVDSGAIKREFKAKKLRFATPDELLELTGLAPGSVPPFGEPILPLELVADLAIGQVSEKVAFNAGTLTNSIIMSAADWVAITRPRRFGFTRTEVEPQWGMLKLLGAIVGFADVIGTEVTRRGWILGGSHDLGPEIRAQNPWAVYRRIEPEAAGVT